MKTLKQFCEEIANVTGTQTTDTNGVSVPATAKPSQKDKVMLFKRTIRRKFKK
jgi:hypothetical protein